MPRAADSDAGVESQVLMRATGSRSLRPPRGRDRRLRLLRPDQDQGRQPALPPAAHVLQTYAPARDAAEALPQCDVPPPLLTRAGRRCSTHRRNVLTVTVAALLPQTSISYDVQMAAFGNTRRLVPISIATFDAADGRVQVTGAPVPLRAGPPS